MLHGDEPSSYNNLMENLQNFATPEKDYKNSLS